MYSNLKRKISDIYRKNIDEGIALLFFSLPYFVYKNSDYLPENNIPVFSFHSVKAESLEEQFKYLSENNYRTLSADSLTEIISGKKKGTRNSVVLTFDDGRKSLWTIAFPLLKKYDLKVVSFIISSIIKEDHVKSPTLEDVWSGKMLLKDVQDIESESPFCTWNEINEMSRSGLVDFQSHSMYHASVFVSKKLVDFINPDFTSSLLESTLNPLTSFNENGYSSTQPEYGFPVYKWKSNLTAQIRYMPNEKISCGCIEYVKSLGGISFFDSSNWRSKLQSYYLEMVGRFGEGTFQSFEERVLEIKEDLLGSKKTIENYVNKPVTHLCLPWYFGNRLTVNLSKEAGYNSVYWGIKNMKSTNYVGDDPFYIKRINDYYIFSLPGKNRISLNKQVMNKIKNWNL